MGLVNSHLPPDAHLTPKKAFSDDRIFKKERKTKSNKKKTIEEKNNNEKTEENNNINNKKEKINEKNHQKLQNHFYTPQVSRQQNDCQQQQQQQHQQHIISNGIITQQKQHNLNNVVYRRKQTTTVNNHNSNHDNNIDQNNSNNINNSNNNNKTNNNNNNNNSVSSPLSLIISNELNRDIFQFIKQPANNNNNNKNNNKNKNNNDDNTTNSNNRSDIFPKLEKNETKNNNKNFNKQIAFKGSPAKTIGNSDSTHQDLKFLQKLIRKTNTQDYKEVCNIVRSSSCYYIADFLESLERLATLDKESLTSPSNNFINDLGSVKNNGYAALQQKGVGCNGFMRDCDENIKSDRALKKGMNVDRNDNLKNDSTPCIPDQRPQNIGGESNTIVMKYSSNQRPACNDIKQDVQNTQYHFDFSSHKSNKDENSSRCLIPPSPNPFPQSPFSPPTPLIPPNSIDNPFNLPYMISSQTNEDTLDSGNIDGNDVKNIHKISCGLCDEKGLLERVEEHKNRNKDKNNNYEMPQNKLVNGPASNQSKNNTFPKNKCNHINNNDELNKKNRNNNNSKENNNENISNNDNINKENNNDNIVIDFFYIDKETKCKVNSVAQVIQMKKNKYCWKQIVNYGKNDRKHSDSGCNIKASDSYNKNYNTKYSMYERDSFINNKEQKGNNIFNKNSHLYVNNSNMNIYNRVNSNNSDNGNQSNMKQALTPRNSRDSVFNTDNKIRRPISLCVIPDTSDRFIPACALSMRHKCLCDKQSRRLCHVMEGRECCVLEVSIEFCRVPVSSALLLGKTFLFNDSLKVLKMTSCCLGDDHVMGLSQGMCRNASLGCVDLASNEITGQGAVYLCGALKKNKSVWSVVLDGNRLSDVGAEAFAKLLKPLKVLKSDKENSMNDKNGVICDYERHSNQIRESLKDWESFCSLKKLSLKDNEINVKGTTSIMKALRNNMYLRDLDLSGNFVDSTSMQHLSDSLLINRSLKLLRLDNCQITDSGCKSLTRALKTNTDLNLLSLDSNCITDNGVESICDALKLNRGLKELSLNFCRVSEAGLDMLVSSVRFNSKLRCIRLCFNDINFYQDVTNNSSSNLEISYQNENFQIFEKNIRKKEIRMKELNALKALEECLKEEDLQWVDGSQHAKLNEKVTFFRHKSFKQRLFMALKRNPSFRIII